MLKNTKDSFGAVSKFFHWVIALLILGLILVGLYMTQLSYSPDKLELYAWHKSFGLMVLWLAGLRIIWRLLTPQPAAHPDHQFWERILAKLVHFFLYIAMIGLPLTGWLMSSAGEYPVPFFGIQMPDLVGKDPSLAQLMNQTHTVMAYLLIGAVGLHALGALKHHFFDGDDSLERMMAKAMHDFGAYVLVIILGLFAIGVFKFGSLDWLLSKQKTEETKTSELESTKIEKSAAGNQWQIVQEQSRLTFKASVYGKEFTGTFPDFDGDIIFDPNNLEKSSADISVSIASVNSDDSERDSQMLGSEWFNVADYPWARFKILTFEKMGTGKYLAVGELTIKNKTLPVSFPFQLDIVEAAEGGNRAFVEGELTVNRQGFGLGEGAWESADIVGLDVSIQIKLVAVSK